MIVPSSDNIRLGCSVCSKYTKSSTYRNHFSTSNSKKISESTFDEKGIKFQKIKRNPQKNTKIKSQCYCTSMVINKTETQFKHICSKMCEHLKVSSTDDSWLNEMINFRRDNWFECHANPFFNDINLCKINEKLFLSKCIKNI